MKQVAEKEAVSLMGRDGKMPPLVRQFIKAYEKRYGCTMEAYMYALRRYARTVENLPSRDHEYKDTLPPELAQLLNKRNYLMNKFLSRHHNRPSIAAKIASARVRE